MSIFKRFRSLLRSFSTSDDPMFDLELDDPTFGHLRGRRSRDYVYWEATDRFTEHGQDASIRIFGEESGPTEYPGTQYRFLDEYSRVMYRQTV